MDFADAPLPKDFDADAHLDAWFNQGNSIGRGPKAPKDIDPKDRVIHDANGPQSANPYPVDSIRSVAAKLGISLPEQPKQADPPGRRALNRPKQQPSPAGYNRPDLVGRDDHDYGISEGPIVPEIDLDAAIADLQRQKEERDRLIQQQKLVQAKHRLQQPNDAVGALLGLLSVYMPEDDFDSNPIVQRIVGGMF